jgi:glycosyltransferase involved in cell wall biosynthesis
MDSLGKSYEIIFINDGSKDSSLKILNEIKLKNDRVKLISFKKNYGKTSAIAAGFRRAKGDFILTVDADLQYDLNDLIRILRELEYNDCVISYRFNRREVDGFIKYISSKIANYVRNKILGENFKDVGCFLAGYKKECLDKLVFYRGFQVFIPSLLNMLGFRIKEIGVRVYPRKYGKSKYNIRNRLFKEFLALLVIKWMQKNRLKYKILNDI